MNKTRQRRCQTKKNCLIHRFEISMKFSQKFCPSTKFSFFLVKLRSDRQFRNQNNSRANRFKPFRSLCLMKAQAKRPKFLIYFSTFPNFLGKIWKIFNENCTPECAPFEIEFSSFLFVKFVDDGDRKINKIDISFIFRCRLSSDSKIVLNELKI